MSLRTERDYEDPYVTQLAVFLQNRVGQLREVLKCLHGAGLVVHALSVSDSTDCAVVRIVADDLARARQALRAEGFATSESSALAVELTDSPTALLDLCRALIQAEVNIHYAYPMLSRPRGRAAMILYVDNVATSTEMLRKNGLSLIDEQDLRPLA